MIQPNTLLQNRYLVERKLGQGGMGAVYQAIDKRFDTMVALKETLVSDENLRKAFEREARLLNKLRHAALPHVIDFFQEGDGQFLVMQYIPGDDLARMLDQNGQPFPADTIVTWTDQILAALEFLHGYDPPIVHRDIKPQNIKLTPQGEVILLDFGLSKGSAVDVSQSAGGASVAGYTPHFAPLEQIRGSGTNPRSDLYSLAATMYHLLTSRMPPDALERASAMLGGRPDPLVPLSQVNPQVAPGVAQIFQIALSQAPENRWASAKAMRNALREATAQAGATMALRQPRDTVVAQRAPATTPASGPPVGQPSSGPTQPSSGPGYPQQTVASGGGYGVPQQQWSAPPASNQNYYTQQPGTMHGMVSPMPSYPTQAPSGSRWVRWTLFGVWVVTGFFISLIAAAIIAVAFFGDDPPTQVTAVITCAFYLIGIVGLLVWCKW